MAERRYALSRAGPTTAGAPLNESQRRAVESDAPRVLILAGAGSGKTRTLTQKVARLITQGTPPERIVLATFTQRAAREMVGRIQALLGPEAARVRAGTFHSLAYRVVKRHHARLGYSAPPSVLDREDQKTLLRAAVAESEVDVTQRRFPGPGELIELLSWSANTGEPLGPALVRRHPELGPLEVLVERALGRYVEKKLAANLADFDDLLLGWRQLLTAEDELGRALRGEAEHVLVDEYQDTTLLQAEISEALASGSGRLVVVGDDAQSIYAFRGARFENILEFPTRAKTEVHLLTESYRSTPQILALANAALAKNLLQFPKELRSRRPAGVLPVLVPAADPRQEAAFIAQRLLELRDEGVPLSECAVLYRAHAQCMELELELTRRDLPYVLRSGVRFFEQAHLKDLLAFLRVLANPKDHLSWHRVLLLLPHVGSKSAERVVAQAALGGAAAEVAARAQADPALQPRARAALARLAAELTRLEAHRGDVRALIMGLLYAGTTEPTLFQECLRAAYPEPEQRLAELEQLAALAHEAPELDDFLAELSLVPDLIPGTGEAAKPEKERLTLSTVHQAKGLEWRVVFVLGLAEGGFPHRTALAESGGEAEERRLFYVAVTRAAEQLYLSFPSARTLKDGERLLERPSRFLTELGPRSELFERWQLEPA